MKIKITKSHGTNNTFIIVYDNHNHKLIKQHIQKICHQFNTDGLLLISDHKDYDYKMDYFNNDGSWETMCANGARCAALFMWKQKKCEENIIFLTGDGTHKIQIKNQDLISLSMIKPLFKTNEIIPNGYKGKFIDSGAKHFVTIIKHNPDNNLIKSEGRKIRFHQIFNPDGTNVNFMKLINKNHIKIWTYEKGIEDMVMSCGSGSVAAAFYAYTKNKIISPIKITVPGGKLSLIFSDDWNDVWLTGPAEIEEEFEIEINY